MIPNQVKFVDGSHKDLTFTRGKGPSRRVSFNGMTWLVDSMELWYSSLGGNFVPNRCVSAEYLEKHRASWIEV